MPRVSHKRTLLRQCRIDLTRMFSEFLANVILVSIGCLGCHIAQASSSAPIFQAGLHYAAVYTGLMHCFGHVSVHIDPALSITMCCLNRISLLQLCMRLLAQYAGAHCGYLLLQQMATEEILRNVSPLCAMPELAAFPFYDLCEIEFLLTFLLLLGSLSAFNRNANEQPLLMGALIGSLYMIGARLTGGGMHMMISLVFYMNTHKTAVYPFKMNAYVSGQLIATVSAAIFWMVVTYKGHIV